MEFNFSKIYVVVPIIPIQYYDTECPVDFLSKKRPFLHLLIFSQTLKVIISLQQQQSNKNNVLARRNVQKN